MKNLPQLTWKEAAIQWEFNELVWSITLGGIGPSYEQCLQILLFEILRQWKDENSSDLLSLYPKIADAVISDLDQVFGFSGSQIGIAKFTAYQFIVYGYSEMLNQVPDDRLIQVSRRFPSLPPPDRKMEW